MVLLRSQSSTMSGRESLVTLSHTFQTKEKHFIEENVYKDADALHLPADSSYS